MAKKNSTKVEIDPPVIKAMKPLKKRKSEPEADLETEEPSKEPAKDSQDQKKAALATSKSASSSDSVNKDSDEVAGARGNVAAFTPPQSSIQTIYVEGFGSSLPEDEIKTALSKHFSACGEITRVFVATSFVTGAVRGFAYIDLKEEDSKKALELNGSVMLGKELVVKKALLMRDSYPGFSGRDRVLGGRFGGRFGGLDVGGRFRGGRCGGLGLCQRVC
ncbi:nucleolin 1 [Capsella rubella]|uniref:nucleolin 1 n=1 Tax=Capsella rubella TaxID=81985 RepID=UPI000CD5C5F1|nr:nucleolin 1 [Capsella rubella]